MNVKNKINAFSVLPSILDKKRVCSNAYERIYFHDNVETTSTVAKV